MLLLRYDKRACFEHFKYSSLILAVNTDFCELRISGKKLKNNDLFN